MGNHAAAFHPPQRNPGAGMCVIPASAQRSDVHGDNTCQVWHGLKAAAVGGWWLGKVQAIAVLPSCQVSSRQRILFASLSEAMVHFEGRDVSEAVAL